MKSKILFVALAFACVSGLHAREPAPGAGYRLTYPALASRLYFLSGNRFFWYSSSASAAGLRSCFLNLLDSAANHGLEKEKYHYSELRNLRPPADSVGLRQADLLFTDAVISYCKDLFQGAGIGRWISNDEVSPVYASEDNDYVLGRLTSATTDSGLLAAVASMEPAWPAYTVWKNELVKAARSGDRRRQQILIACINQFRWIHHFHFAQRIVVNIPAATLQYDQHDSVRLLSKVVVGKVATRSPRFSSWCYQVVLYPYWNVPRDIGVRELLPRMKRSPGAMEKMNMQLTTPGGRVVNHHGLNWSQFSRSNFPYIFRQCTGCDNSLGVIKFNLSDPFDVYLHDTNFKLAFLKDTRFLSHGCIRVEQAIALGNALLGDRLDSGFLKACYKDQLPRRLNLDKKVPVFVVYMPAEVRGDSVVYYNDVYRLFR